MTAAAPTSQFITCQRLQLHYVDWGNAAAAPLLLLHGARDHCRSWDWLAPALRGRWHVLALDLRGHGDSAWSPDGDYSMLAMVCDLALLVGQLDLPPVTIVGHSLGGNIALRYAGLYPERVRRVVCIEGLGPSPKLLAERQAIGFRPRIRDWIAARQAAGTPRRYASLEDALQRMRAANPHLEDERARHLTEHAVRRNEDGSWSWKFDDTVRAFPPVDLTIEQVHELWHAIQCPTLLCYGDKSWASNPQRDGRLAHFRHARLVSFPDAGHWVHHDQLPEFLAVLQEFLAA